jgi:hypothetical protein
LIHVRKPEIWSPGLLEKVGWRKQAADEPFRGVAAGYGITPGLFPLKRTGADVKAVAAAAAAYLSSLSQGELAEGRFAMDHQSWRHWSNGARYFLRHGLCLEDFDAEKRRLALNVIRASLSDAGFTQVTDLMRLNRTVGELRDELDLLNEWLYWFSVYGRPERGEPWGWQLDGHHVNVNCVFVGDQVTLTPTFLGAEPVIATGGKYAGTRAFRQEEAAGFEFFASLDDMQQAEARIGDILPPDLFVGAFRDNFELNYEGLRFGKLDSAQFARALDLISQYVGRAPEGHARVRMAEVRQHAAETYFAWVGSRTPGGVFYYRIQSPVILIEFEHQAGVMFDNDEPSRQHIHTVVRTPNGNDYGIDLLRQHHERYHAVPGRLAAGPADPTASRAGEGQMNQGKQEKGPGK